MKFILRLLTTTALIVSNSTAKAQIHNGNSPLVKDPDAFIAAEQAYNREIDALRKKAASFISKREIVKAIPILKQILLEEDASEDSRVMLADIYSRWNRPNDTAQVLQPMYDSAKRHYGSVQGDVVTRMKYVLALLDTGKWEDAAKMYEQSVPEPLPWMVPPVGMRFNLKLHTLPSPHFSPDIVDGPGLRAQAHLILGTQEASYMSLDKLQDNTLSYLLDHLQQAIKSDRRNVDAHFLRAVLLAKMDRFDEARAAFEQTTKLAPREAKPEIKIALDALNSFEEFKKNLAAQQSKLEAKSQFQNPPGS